MEYKTKITVECTVKASIEKVWNYWTSPQHIMHWNNANDDWHTPKVENNLINGGNFKYTMAAKDGSFSFDFEGTYLEIKRLKLIKYIAADGREVSVDFITIGDIVEIVETFEAENENSIELQKNGWQAILNNFKKYVETN